MPKKSAGILFYRLLKGELEVLLVHPGGPFWKKKDLGAWSIPKGEVIEGEDILDTAIRETREETGIDAKGLFTPLAQLKQKNGKIIYAWAVRSDFDSRELKSNTFKLEWPPKSGKEMTYPEIDRAEWFTIAEAMKKIIPGQSGFIAELQELLFY